MAPRPITHDTPWREQLHLAGVHLLNIVRYCPTELVEVINALILWGWGLAIALPSDSFANIASYAAFRETSVPELAWGLAAMALAKGYLVALAFRARRARMVALCLAGLFWGFIATAIFVSVPFNTGVTTYGGLAIACTLVYLRHRH